MFLICGTLGLEAWPLTAFRLFSRLRGESRTLWVADTVSRSGEETHLWFTQLPRAYQGFGLIMPEFAKLSASEKAATCEAWLREARRVQSAVAALRIYRVSWWALPRVGKGSAPPSRVLMYACR